ncbi:MAG: nucleoside-diphosphate kinase [Candidatus Protochlamydia sp.]|nr:nucleoside-diphosphate kinase [Candidatus Protochlamydia sp.]
MFQSGLTAEDTKTQPSTFDTRTKEGGSQGSESQSKSKSGNDSSYTDQDDDENDDDDEEEDDFDYTAQDEDDDEDDDDEDEKSNHTNLKGGSHTPAGIIEGKNNPSSVSSIAQPIQQPIAVVEQTLSIIKPDGVKNNHVGDIISRFEDEGLKVVALKMTKLNKEQAGQFYQEHKERPFYNELVQFMTSGPVVLVVLEGKNAVAKNRELMGATNPQKADRGTIRADFAESVTKNTVHGSDSQTSAKKEINFFFQPQDLNSR